ncbi:DUF1697 domain-containing protein [Devosia lacusdianchii]|jgi:uncharacterized protein (DUF1697 family)|uniref:DUF1697 domain-containing protein n=1 Tax=Devosia lacusdianchii TaxID=2917991 RepID=UPI001F069DE9|nr:DUF1697 domain-containing protein [Devosia sp. JXJ CY 41]
MTAYAVLLRGINVGGKNKVLMGELKKRLDAHGFDAVATYAQSGNVILRSELSAEAVAESIEQLLPAAFQLGSTVVKVIALSQAKLRAVVDDRPKGFGDQPQKYHSDAIFLMGIDIDQALTAFDPREGVDTIWPGDGVIYSQRLSAMRTKTRLNKMMTSPLYKSMTIRSWSTTLGLLDFLGERDR